MFPLNGHLVRPRLVSVNTATMKPGKPRGAEEAMARSAYDYALDLLSARAYTARNLRRKLALKGFSSEEADSAIERLMASGLLDDRRFAADFARQKLVHGGYSVRRVEAALRNKGIASPVIRATIEEVAAEETIDVEKTLDRLIRKKLASLSGLEEVVRRRRIMGFLARRGFDLDDIRRAIERSVL